MHAFVGKAGIGCPFHVSPQGRRPWIRQLSLQKKLQKNLVHCQIKILGLYCRDYLAFKKFVVPLLGGFTHGKPDLPNLVCNSNCKWFIYWDMSYRLKAELETFKGMNHYVLPSLIPWDDKIIRKFQADNDTRISMIILKNHLKGKYSANYYC